MALAINSKFLSEDYIRWVAAYIGYVVENTNRCHAYRIIAHATVIHDESLVHRLRVEQRKFDLMSREALDWQPDQDDDLDEVEVLHHLHQQAKTSPLLRKCSLQTDRKDATTTLLTSCTVQSPSLPASAKGRPLSSFHRCSLRQSILAFPINVPDPHTSNIRELIPSAPDSRIILLPVSPQLVGDPWQQCVLWQLQVDFVDLLSPRSPGKRRRTTLNPFHQVSSPPVQESSPANHLPQAKRFRGVRQREERKTWAAEMKPPKQSKVSFGEFRSEAQAARAIDAAYHYYDKPHLLNFPDTPRILSTRPSPAGVLDEKDKLRFVKEQVKWLASIAATLPSSPPRVPSEIPKSSSKGCTAGPSGFRSVGKLASFLSLSDGDEGDDAISQARPSLHEVQLDGLLSNSSMEPNLVGADVVSAIFPSEQQRSLFPLNSEYALVDSCLPAQLAPSTSVRITDGWDGAEHSVAPSVTNFGNSTQPSITSQELWVNYLAMSPPTSMIPMPSSPCNIGTDIEPFSLERDSFADAWI